MSTIKRDEFFLRGNRAVHRSKRVRLFRQKNTAQAVANAVQHEWHEHWGEVFGLSREGWRKRLQTEANDAVFALYEMDNHGPAWMFIALQIAKIVVEILMNLNWPEGKHPVTIREDS